eukprot:gb/GEZN01011699.1/.p1 GENE.gb/GEZN01011699.1/~~gb/GEZN01011699.1/.p1  ORF type:complete len:337 (+),score=8.92 gb/GEZN01011699.1/:90-1100(+)
MSFASRARVEALRERLYYKPTAAERAFAAAGSSAPEKFAQTFDWASPSKTPHFSWRNRIGYLLVLILDLIRIFCYAIRVQRGWVKGEDVEFVERVPNRLWQIKYRNHMGDLNCSLVLRGKDGSLLLMQAPPPIERVFTWLSSLGTLEVIVEPDSVHDSFSRQWKLLLPYVTFLCTKESQEKWSKAGDASFIDAVFVSTATGGPACELLQKYYFAEHIGAQWLTWCEYAHVIRFPDMTVLLSACPVGNLKLSGLDGWFCWIAGRCGYRVFYDAPKYCSPHAFERGGSFELYMRACVNALPYVVLFKHGEPLDGARIDDVRYGLGYFGRGNRLPKSAT